MKILVIGSAAREHAIASALDAEGGNRVCVLPGNDGIAQTIECIDSSLDPRNTTDLLDKVAQFDLVVIGPEGPLANGLVDQLRLNNITVFGPTQAAAQIETSKHFAKEIMQYAGVPTAKSVLVDSAANLSRALKSTSRPYVVKANGVAAGKGAIVTGDRHAAYKHGTYWLQKGPVLIEEYIKGREVSLFFLCDGKNLIPLAPAQDYKRLGESDTGPNTGGMGSHSPVTDLPLNFIDTVQDTIAHPVIRTMALQGFEFSGLLYCGLAICDDGPKVIEFNARFGDPETQVILPRLATPLSDLLMATAKGDLHCAPKPQFHDSAAVCIVLASGGYPEIPARDTPIIGLHNVINENVINENVLNKSVINKNIAINEGVINENDISGTFSNNNSGVQVLFAGVRKSRINEPNILHSHGGRIMNIVALDETFTKARQKAYRAVDQISITNKQFRRDVALSEEIAERKPEKHS